MSKAEAALTWNAMSPAPKLLKRHTSTQMAVLHSFAVTGPTRGTSAAYRVSKLKRDRPDIAERLAHGEYKSVSAAERAALGR